MNLWKEKYDKIIDSFERYEKTKIPLCAAETYTSSFSLKGLATHIEGQYGFNKMNTNNDFIGGDIVLELKKLSSELCKNIFHAQHSNFDTMTGMSCITYTIMALLNTEDKVLITSPQQGGHPSLPIILETLGIEFDEIPYDFSKFQIDYDATNILINSNVYKSIIFSQSDILCPPELECFNFPKDFLIIYDCTQTLGLIAGKTIKNPLEQLDNIVLLGGSHKTLPAASCGIIMSNNHEIIKNLENKISPNFLRYIQPNHIASLILALIEFQEFGYNYCNKIKEINLYLSNLLTEYGFNVAKISSKEYSKTHQIFILTSKEKMDLMFCNAHKFNITLNKKSKTLFRNYGIRLGVQQIAQYGWEEAELKKLARLLYLVSQKDIDINEINSIRKFLIGKKIPTFSYDNCIIE